MAPSDTLRHLKKQSKALLRDFLASNDDAVRSVRAVFRQSSGLTLQQAQHVIARQYGFEHWQALSQATPSQVHKAISHYRSSTGTLRNNEGRTVSPQADTANGDRPIIEAGQSLAVHSSPDVQQERSAAHPAALDLDLISKEVLRVVRGKKVVWKPAPAPASGEQDGCWRGLEYLREGSKGRRDWEAHWPSNVAIPAWDLVGRAQIGKGGCWEWVCVKIFHEPDELMAGTPPQQAATLNAIEQIFEDAKHTSRAPAEANWISAGFDVATLIAIRAYSSSKGGCGRMVFMCVGGDEWLLPMEEAKKRFGIGRGCAVSNRLSWTLLKR